MVGRLVECRLETEGGLRPPPGSFIFLKEDLYPSCVVLASRGDDVRTYLKIHFNSEGETPMDIIKRVKNIGFIPVVGDYDFVIDYKTPTEYSDIIKRLHDTLAGSKVYYRLVSRDGK